MNVHVRGRVLAQFVAEPSVDNRNAVVNAHSYLCARGARKFYRGTLERSDLEQIAAVGLIKACERFSTDYDTPFEAYAWLMIVGELMHFVRDHERIVRIPRALRALDSRFIAVYEELMMRLEREPTCRDLAGELCTSLEQVDELRASRTLGAVLNEQHPVSQPPVAIEDCITLELALRSLSDRELRVIQGIYVEEFSQQRLGAEIGLSQRQTSRVLQRALQRLACAIAG